MEKSLFLKGFIYLSLIYSFAYFFGFNAEIVGFIDIRNAFLGFSMLAFIVFALSHTPPWFGKKVLKLFIIVSLICFVIDLFCYINFSSNLSIPMCYALFETTLQESWEFLGLYLNAKTLLAIVLFLSASFLYYKIPFSFVGKKIYIVFAVFSFVGIINWIVECHKLLFTMSPYYTHQNLAYFEPIRIGMNMAYTLETKEKTKQEFDFQLKSLKQNLKAQLQENPIQNIVLLLGESAQRGHMQLYGYTKPTSPYMTVLEKTKNLLVFDDVISPHAQTSLSIPKIFTLANYENEAQGPWYQRATLISFFKTVGYKTYWLSNQEPALYITPAGMLASICDQSLFVSAYKQFHDGALLPYIDQILKERGTHKQFLTIHLIGVHNAYADRYPVGFGIFKSVKFNEKKRKIALYDNAMLYNDNILNEIFKRFSQSDSIVIYLSDHGEEIYEIDDFIGHGENRITRFTCEIPMLIYVSDLFIQKHPELYKRLKSSIHRPFMSDDLIHMILDIAGIKTPEFDPTRSVIHEKFDDKRKRIVGGSRGSDYDKELKGQKSRY
ncbi:phosphoethanolamine transferase [Helicobacter cholecystus]|uniref:phosphoethanolamine transferase n=1 Tax=Helicobacter cholecystus TaxID=45498 RepID=UPI002739402C|nr:phosphoethanolamine transferase [Helicobacter cholecystus]